VPGSDRDELAETEHATAPRAPSAGELAPGTVLERYVIEKKLGSGAMGVVYEARDPQLDRAVAIKVLAAGDDDDELRARLYREAQALARVDHANVVSVYDVGSHEGRVFVAMELVRGQTLRSYLATRRTEAEILAMLVGAGRGLVAAHRAGLVHRDFKPDNVLVGDDGVPRVTDFGLARVAGPDEAPGASLQRMPKAPPTVSSSLDSALTETGSLLGTPVYSAPEQLAGDRAGPLADQYAFCVTTYEAFVGYRPFRAQSLPELIEQTSRRLIAPEPPDRKMPPRVRRAVRRGLSAIPADRFPTMSALLAELAPGPRRRWPWIAAGVAAVAIAAMLIVALGGVGGGDAPRCRTADERMAGVWDARVKDRVVAAFADLPGYADVGPKLALQLDGYATRWRGTWREVCTSGEQSSTMFDRRIACLEDRRTELGAVASSLAGADRAIAATAFDLLGGMGDLHRCGNANLLEAAPPPPAQAKAVDDIRMGLALANVYRGAHEYDKANDALEPAVARARALGYAPALAEALLVQAELALEQGKVDVAEAAARESSNLAIGSSDKRLVVLSLFALAEVRRAQGATNGVDDTLSLAKGALAPLGSESADLVVRYHLLLALLRADQVRPDESIAEFGAAAALLEKGQPRDDRALAAALTGRGQMLDQHGRHAEAAKDLERAHAIMNELAGPTHPLTVAIMARIASNMSNDKRNFAKVIEMAQQAYGLTVLTLGADSVEACEIEDMLASVQTEMGDFERAFASYRHMISVYSAIDPHNHSLLVTRGDLAYAMTRAGQAKQALVDLAGLRADMVASAGEGTPMTAFADLVIAEAHLGAGDARAGLAALEKADAVFLPALGPDSPVQPRVHSARGRALLALGKPAEALPALRRAAKGFEREPSPYVAAETQLAIADASWRTGDKLAATAATATAIAELDALSPTAAPLVRERIAAWRRAHAK
jgi:eukaryotic-like serine/threonine-protein kinase